MTYILSFPRELKGLNPQKCLSLCWQVCGRDSWKRRESPQKKANDEPSHCWKDCQRKRKQQDMQYKPVFATHQVCGVVRNAILNWGMQECHPSLQTFRVRENWAGGRGTAGWRCWAWGYGLLLKQEGVLQVVRTLFWRAPERDLLAALFAGMQEPEPVTLASSEWHAPPMAGDIRLIFWQGADSPSPAAAQSQRAWVVWTGLQLLQDWRL